MGASHQCQLHPGLRRQENYQEVCSPGLSLPTCLFVLIWMRGVSGLNILKFCNHGWQLLGGRNTHYGPRARRFYFSHLRIWPLKSKAEVFWTFLHGHIVAPKHHQSPTQSRTKGMGKGKGAVASSVLPLRNILDAPSSNPCLHLIGQNCDYDSCKGVWECFSVAHAYLIPGS